MKDGFGSAVEGFVPLSVSRSSGGSRSDTWLSITDMGGSDAAEVEVMKELGYRALLAVSICDRQRGYLLEIYSDGHHAELAAIAPHARVLAHYCIQAVAGRPALPEAAHFPKG